MTDKKIIVWFGSLQSLSYEKQLDVLLEIRNTMQVDDKLVITFDVTDASRKDIIELSYLDPEGYSEKFYLNSIHRLNREMNGNIDVSKFKIKNELVANSKSDNCSYVNVWIEAIENCEVNIAQSGNTEVVKCLQTLGKLDINKMLPNNHTALSIFVSEMNSKVFERGLKPIQYLAEKHGGSETMKVLLNFGANVNEPWVKIARRSCLRQSPLFMALKHGIRENAKTLIECRADVSFVGQTSNTDMGSIGCFSLAARDLTPRPYWTCCPKGQSNLTPHDKDPPLIVATMKNLREVLEYLIKGGAKLDAVSRDGDTAIVVCCEKASQEYYQTLDVLIESGASLNIASKREYPLEILSKKLKDIKHSGFNHLMGALLAYQSQDNDEIEKCVTKMLTKGANPNITREGRNSPLIIAVQKQSENLVQILLNAGADIFMLVKIKEQLWISASVKVNNSDPHTTNVFP
ncbi:unnamed protein product [Mytilus edulis]|uniref:Histidine-specific methyltransferase SAM-dependent domain-containing protein n=1 Tax=Mytilus edulis TaxID=6550 RepID=A0A8S3SFC2_MYTED|nr:unnamed protein product [Mytilus edulis]